jgi:hypothetical protein
LPGRADVEAFLASGYSEQQILEIVLAIAVKTLSNYANHLFHTPVDSLFASRAWTDLNLIIPRISRRCAQGLFQPVFERKIP